MTLALVEHSRNVLLIYQSVMSYFGLQIAGAEVKKHSSYCTSTLTNTRKQNILKEHCMWFFYGNAPVTTKKVSKGRKIIF